MENIQGEKIVMKEINYVDVFNTTHENKEYKCRRYVFGKKTHLIQTVSVEGIIGNKYDGDGGYTVDNDSMKAVAKKLAYELIVGL